MAGMTWFDRVVLILAVAGTIVAGLLTSFHYSEAAEKKFCTAGGGCETVNTSKYATVGPVPVAVIGLAGYVAIAAVVLASLRTPRVRRMAPLAVFGMAFIGVLYSAYLTYLELYVIHAICPWCVVSAVLITTTCAVALVELRRTTAAERAAAS